MNRALLLLMVASLVPGCGGSTDDGPPHVELGRDECVHCGMILTDERSVAAILVSRDAQLTPLLFDDIGDLIDYERANPKLQVVRRYVHDFETRQWIDASQAVFLRSTQLHTPMGSGIAGFNDLDRAKSQQRKEQGELHTSFSALSSSRTDGE
jgi:copper chaperone NosL